MIEFGEYKVDAELWETQFSWARMKLQRRARLDREGGIIAHKDTIKKLRNGERVRVQLVLVGDTLFDPTALKRLKLCAL